MQIDLGFIEFWKFESNCKEYSVLGFLIFHCPSLHLEHLSKEKDPDLQKYLNGLIMQLGA